MTLPLRYSLQGPFITNSAGGTATPGDGFQLRLAESQASGAGVQFVTSAFEPYLALIPGPDPNINFVATLPNPREDLRYKVNAHFEVRNSSTDTFCVLTTQLQVSYDGQATWETLPLAENETTVEPLAYRTVTIDQVLALGADLAAPVPEDAPSLTVRIACQASDDVCLVATEGGEQGTAWMSIAELL